MTNEELKKLIIRLLDVISSNRDLELIYTYIKGRTD